MEGFNAVKAIRSSAPWRNRKLQFISSNCSDRIILQDILQFRRSALFREDKFSRAATFPSSFSFSWLDDVAENKWVIGFRRKIPEQEADGVSEELKASTFYLQHLTFHPASHLPLTLNQSFRADKVSHPLRKRQLLDASEISRVMLKSALLWPTITSRSWRTSYFASGCKRVEWYISRINYREESGYGWRKIIKAGIMNAAYNGVSRTETSLLIKSSSQNI